MAEIRRKEAERFRGQNSELSAFVWALLLEESGERIGATALGRAMGVSRQMASRYIAELYADGVLKRVVVGNSVIWEIADYE